MRYGERLNLGLNVSQWLNGNPRGIRAIGAATDTISGGYRIIRFEGSGKLIVANNSVNLEYLLVAGGGGGGSAIYDGISSPIDSGGGGGGGVVTNMGSPTNFSKGEYRILVGTGGSPFNNGLPSLLGDIVAYGGGAGAGSQAGFVTIAPKSGGNGGGGCSLTATVEAGALPLFTGFKGGDSDQGSNWEGGGGGGAGAAGANATTSAGGAGGAGVANSITGTSVTYGGGGGGGSSDTGAAGAGGSGGGGAGSKDANATNGTNFLGGGGGGAGRTTGITTYTGGTGGTGVVIVRYAV